MKIASLLLVVAAVNTGCASLHLSLFGADRSDVVRVDLAGGPDHDYRIYIKNMSGEHDRLKRARDYLQHQCSSVRLVREHSIRTEDLTFHVLEVTCNR